tara:strand:+ start:536 stop:727 length:192 start_codon:yes stop_codon:yes gene_type:complete
MVEAGSCIECGKMRPIHKGSGNKYWCKICSHLAPTTILKAKKPETNRVTIKWNIGDKEGEEEE